MDEFNVALVAIGGIVLGLGLFARSLRATVFSIPLLALVFGILISPEGLGLLHPEQWGRPEAILEQAARLTIAIGLMGVALRLPPGFLRQHWRSLSVLLGLGMPLMWLSSSLLAYWLLDLPILVALLAGAVVSPTDPIVASSIVTGELAEDNLPDRVRHTISAESGANDGLAYPIVLLPILLLTKPEGEVWEHWLVHTVLWEVGIAVLFGILLGVAAGHLLRWAEARKTVGQHSFLAFSLALTLVVLGAAKLLGTDGILAVFATGVALDRTANANERHQEERVQETVNQFFTLPIFTLLGLMLPWAQWREWGWAGVALAIAVLLLRRLPFILLLRSWTPQLRKTRDALFMGWFGPIGVAAIFYAVLAMKRTNQEAIWGIGSLLVCASLVAHGITASPLTKLYGRRAQD
ncbi:Na(+)/H(+) antiporter 1 [Fibrisoma limi BUZ 3]|uniref:Na(+)/H(+) antiporter 1 n=2 Tax=Fibrisoma limi TaxID=663275 RepID=I2GNX4_9BACT|nr:Na(+)/H(+) antiporter 1 [Fibrisoma limi BUZ 3]